MRYLLILFFALYASLDSFGKMDGPVSDDSCFPEIYQMIEAEAYEEAVVLLESLIPTLKAPNLLGEAYFSLAYAHDRLGRPLKAIGFYLLASENYEKTICVGNAFENIGLIYKRFNQHDKAVYYLSKALSYDTDGRTRGKMKRLYHRAAAYRRSDQVEMAIDDLLEAENIAFELNQDTFRAKIYNQLGLLYKFRGELGKSGSYFFEALQIAETGDIYHNYGNLKKELGDTASAEHYLLRAIALAKGATLINSCMDLGELYYHSGNQARAEHYLRLAADFYEKEPQVYFDQVKLFTTLARVVDDTSLVFQYQQRAIAEYEKFGTNLLKSNELFFGAVAEQKIRNLEIKRDMRETANDHLLIFVALSVLLLIVIIWLITRISRSMKDKRIRRAFKKLEDVLYDD